MLTIKELIGNAPLSAEQYRVIEQEAVIAAREQWQVVNQLVSPIAGTLGEQRYTYDTLIEVAAAETAMGFIEGDDQVNFNRSNVDIPIIQAPFKIDYRALLSSQRNGTALDGAAAASSGYRVGQGFADLITQGWKPDGSNYDIEGLYQGAGNSYSTSKDFGTAGNAIAAVSGGIALMTADNIFPPYHLSLNSVQHAELIGSVHTGGVMEFERVRDIIGGSIFINPNLVAGTGMLTSTPAQGHLRVKMAQDMTTELWRETLDPRANTKGRAFTAAVPVIRDSNAICTLTDI